MRRMIFLTVFLVGICPQLFAQMIDNTHDRVQTTLDIGFKRIGTVMPRSAREVGRSKIAIGCEMLPRDYGDFEQFKEYIPPLGITRIRLHAGWSKIERIKGIYDFEWLDKQVNYLMENGLDVLLETSYGNSIYLGGGGPSLSDGLPQGKEALAAWDRYVDALSKHYSKVIDWACWNEPNNKKSNTPDIVADNNIRTAEIIKKNIPNARIAGLVASNTNPKYVEEYMKILKEKEKIGLFEWIIYHDYSVNPDTCYKRVEQFIRIVHKYGPNLKIWQGESGATSDPHYSAPISSGKWNTELTQCKWNARRVIGDLGHDIETLVFTFYDPAYDHPERYSHFIDPIWIRTRTDRFMKRMGLVKCNEDFKVLKVKPAYYTVQNLASVFDSSIDAVSYKDLKLDYAKKYAIYAFRQKKTNAPLLAYWDCSSNPENNNATVPADLTAPGFVFKDPVWLDIITGAVYEIPADRIVVKKDGTSIFKKMPVYDAPALIAEKSMLLKK